MVIILTTLHTQTIRNLIWLPFHHPTLQRLYRPLKIRGRLPGPRQFLSMSRLPRPTIYCTNVWLCNGRSQQHTAQHYSNTRERKLYPCSPLINGRMPIFWPVSRAFKTIMSQSYHETILPEEVIFSFIYAPAENISIFHLYISNMVHHIALCRKMACIFPLPDIVFADVPPTVQRHVLAQWSNTFITSSTILRQKQARMAMVFACSVYFPYTVMNLILNTAYLFVRDQITAHPNNSKQTNILHTEAPFLITASNPLVLQIINYFVVVPDLLVLVGYYTLRDNLSKACFPISTENSSPSFTAIRYTVVFIRTIWSLQMGIIKPFRYKAIKKTSPILPLPAVYKTKLPILQRVLVWDICQSVLSLPIFTTFNLVLKYEMDPWKQYQ